LLTNHKILDTDPEKPKTHRESFSSTKINHNNKSKYSLSAPNSPHGIVNNHYLSVKKRTLQKEPTDLPDETFLYDKYSILPPDTSSASITLRNPEKYSQTLDTTDFDDIINSL